MFLLVRVCVLFNPGVHSHYTPKLKARDFHAICVIYLPNLCKDYNTLQCAIKPRNALGVSELFIIARYLITETRVKDHFYSTHMHHLILLQYTGD